MKKSWRKRKKPEGNRFRSRINSLKEAISKGEHYPVREEVTSQKEMIFKQVFPKKEVASLVYREEQDFKKIQGRNREHQCNWVREVLDCKREVISKEIIFNKIKGSPPGKWFKKEVVSRKIQDLSLIWPSNKERWPEEKDLLYKEIKTPIQRKKLWRNEECWWWGREKTLKNE